MTNVVERLARHLRQGNLRVRMIRGINSEEEPVWEEGRAPCVDRVMGLKSQESFTELTYRGDLQTQREKPEGSGVWPSGGLRVLTRVAANDTMASHEQR